MDRQKPEAAGHTVSAAGKQRAMDEAAGSPFPPFIQSTCLACGDGDSHARSVDLPGNVPRTDTPKLYFHGILVSVLLL